MAMPDVTVMGAGIFGLAVAHACARRGAKVRVVERSRIGAGASGGPVGALAPHVPENWNPKKAFQYEALVMAAEYWADVEAASGLTTGYARTGRVQPIEEGVLALARARAGQAERLWQGRAVWQIQRGDAGGWVLPDAAQWTIRDTLTARIDPMAACLALAWALRGMGGEIAFGDRPGAAPGCVVWATGADGLEALSAATGDTMGSGVKGQAVALRFDARDRPQVFVDGLHVVPHANGTVAIGSTTERTFTDGAAPDRQCDELVRRAVRACPELAGADVVWRWAGVRPRSRSRAPVIGPWPGRPGHFIANGGFKIGLGIAPRVGEVVADMILDDRDAVPEGFRVEDNRTRA